MHGYTTSSIMRTVELVAQRTLEVFDRPMVPDPGPGEVLVKLHAVGICGSDLHWFEDGGIGHTRAIYPMVLGHEPVGEVVAVGRDAETHAVGQRVVIEPSVVCGKCEFCLAGRPNNCVKCVFMGGTQAPGFFRDYAVVPVRNAEHIPDDLDYLSATLIEPTAVLVHVFELIDFRPGDSVAVLGAGPIGLLAAAMARVRGADQIFLADRVAHRLRIGRQMDQRLVCIHTRQESVTETVLDATHGRGVDIVLDAAGALETINAGLAIARSSGQYVLIGLPTEHVLAIDMHTAMAKELRIQTVKRSNLKGHEAMELVHSGKVSDILITHRMPLEHTAEGFELLANYRDGVGKVVIEL